MVKHSLSPESVYFECLAEPEKQLDFLKAEIRANVFVFPGDAKLDFNIRLTDADGEIFQFRNRLPLGDGKWHELVFEIDATEKYSSWGGEKKADGFLTMPVTFRGITLDYTDGKDAEIGVGVITSRIIKSNAPVAVALETGEGTPIHVLRANGADRAVLSVRNGRPRPMRGVLRWELTGPRGEKSEIRDVQLALDPDEEKKLELPVPARFGVYKLAVSVTDADSKVKSVEKKFTFGRMDPAGPVTGGRVGFIFGVCSHPQWHSIQEQELEAMAAGWCGATAVREDVGWHRMQPVPDRWNFGPYDRTTEIFAKYGIRIQPILSYCPGWAKVKGYQPLNPDFSHSANPDLESWRKFVRTFTERYAKKVHFIEVWNEPDLYMFANFPAADYVRMMEGAYEEIKRVDPKLQVLCGGFACLPGQSGRAGNPEVMPAVIRSGKYDVFAFHGHGLFNGYRNQIEQLSATGNTKSWYSNETAVSSMIYGDEVQAQTLFRKLIFAWAHGAIGYNWYDLRNDGFSSTENEHNFGLVTKDFQPKPAYIAYNALAANYGGATFRKAADLGTELRGYLFSGRGGETLLAAWSDSNNNRTTPILVSGVNGIASLIDLYGNGTALDAKNGTVSFDVGREPATLKITGQKGELAILGAQVSPAGDLEIVPGESARWEFEFVNPESLKQSFRISLEPPDGLEIKHARQSISLGAGEKRRIAFDVKADADFRSFPGRTRLQSMQLDGRNYRFETGSITCLPENGFRKLPDFTLNDASQVSVLVPNSPETASLFWSGPADLSANVWLGRNGEELLLRIETTDDRHVQPFTGFDVWRADNIQLGLKLPKQRGYWEFGLTRTDGGTSETFCWNAPFGFDAGKAAAQIKLVTSRDEAAKKTSYEARIPFAALDLKSDSFQFNLLVNDSDGRGRESFICIAPGIGESKDPCRWPTVKTR